MYAYMNADGRTDGRTTAHPNSSSGLWPVELKKTSNYKRILIIVMPHLDLNSYSGAIGMTNTGS